MTDATKAALKALDLPLQADLARWADSSNAEAWTAAMDAQDAYRILTRSLERLERAIIDT